MTRRDTIHLLVLLSVLITFADDPPTAGAAARAATAPTWPITPDPQIQQQILQFAQVPHHFATLRQQGMTREQLMQLRLDMRIEQHRLALQLQQLAQAKNAYRELPVELAYFVVVVC